MMRLRFGYHRMIIGWIRCAAYFVRWQLLPVITSLPDHVAFVARAGRRATMRRLMVAIRLTWIHLRVPAGHNPMELLLIVEDVLGLAPNGPGVIVECGSFTGASSAKLSLAAALTKRRLVVCDSFRGLPAAGADDNLDPSKKSFGEGDYAGSLDLVRETVRKYGVLEVVDFVPGWFDESLQRLAGQPIACAFWDVDLAASFRSCIRHLWPQVMVGAKVFIHDIDREAVVGVFTDASWWQREIGIAPPSVVGLKRGVSRSAPLLGYVIKRAGGTSTRSPMGDERN